MGFEPWPVWLNGWVFVYNLSGCGFESCCCHLKILNISLITRIIKNLDLYAYSFQKLVYMKNILIKLNVSILWQKMKKILINIWKFGKNSELIYNKKYLKAEKKLNTTESFQCFYIPIILIDSVSRKDEIYYP